ncbi:diguanylate cyclase (GGDEF) domain-containing protein/HDIG domain-containing protein [Tepidibacter formicigenes DSM 15518]|uniref:Diguanylate cyclase (GGDEF) domain-containing protein/HDIG domain-containing protein n=2 Tax=Tepidibacter formicigenes DSM 15518 TaxID=1123349 RepID=A0A1M6R0T3_9FIRM|nr:diguanylate cyclase (GGDEF) domain-containing protein/HDIG domain-containing protein [Tepidibacter formicigenes DSM 15518]
MHKFKKSREERICKIISSVKLISLFFYAIIIFSRCNFLYTKNSKIYIQYNIITAFISITLLILIYEGWILFLKNNQICIKTLRIIDIIEILIFIAIVSILIFISGGYLSNYKFLFLFIIITSTIQFGMKCGTYVSAIGSIFILGVDILSMLLNTVNKYFETDLILSGVFVLTSWLLGYYVKVENEYREQLADLVNKDELTGVYNHRFFQDSLTRGIAQCKKENSTIALLFIDIDHFKYYNDLYGHQKGDYVLREIGCILKNNIRDKDIVARYGGEEFAVILPRTSEGEAFLVGERIRSKIEEYEFEGEEHLPNGKLTVSIGVSYFPEKSKNKEELINSADDALYRAKFFNKNRVEIYYSILEELKGDIEDKHIDLISSIKTLISVINAKDRYTYGHTERVVIYCDLLADKLGLSEEEKKILRYGAYLHDIGKIHIPQELLNKKMPLTNDEWNILKKHSENGVEIIKTVDSLKNVIPLILHHHEKYDGTGYPNGLKGDKIPYLTRILTVADSFDAMTSNRPYKSRKSYNEAIEELKKYSSIQFDSAIVDAFIEVININKHVFEKVR